MFELTISLSWWMVGFVKDLNDFPEISSSSVLSLSRSVYYFLSNMLKPFKRYFEILYVCLFVYLEFCTLWYLLCFPHHMIHYSFEFAVRLFQLKLWVRTPFMARCTRYIIILIKFVSDLWQVYGFFPGSCHVYIASVPPKKYPIKYSHFCWYFLIEECHP